MATGWKNFLNNFPVFLIYPTCVREMEEILLCITPYLATYTFSKGAPGVKMMKCRCSQIFHIFWDIVGVPPKKKLSESFAIYFFWQESNYI